jgi:hypothetical protein
VCQGMSSPKQVGVVEPSRQEAPLPSATSRLPGLSLEEDYFATPQIPVSSPSPNTELPASLALPLGRTRSSTPQSPVPLRAKPSVSVDDDSASIRSFVPTLSAGDDLEAMLSEMLDSDARWRLEQDEFDDGWEGQSESDSDSDIDSQDPEDDGQEPALNPNSNCFLEIGYGD